jgi:hypothetical protein
MKLSPLERDIKIFQNPDLLDNICAHVSSGGSVITLAELWQVNYGVLMNWIRLDKDRQDRYAKALQDRKEWSLETVLHELTKIGTADPDEVLRTGDKIKALELVGKTVAMFTDKVEQSGVIKLEDLVSNSMKIKEE